MSDQARKYLTPPVRVFASRQELEDRIEGPDLDLLPLVLYSPYKIVAWGWNYRFYIDDTIEHGHLPEPLNGDEDPITGYPRYMNQYFEDAWDATYWVWQQADMLAWITPGETPELRVWKLREFKS